MANNNIVKVTEDIYCIRLPLPFELNFVNIYLVKSGEKIILIDSGWHNLESLNCLTESLNDLNIDISDINMIVLTHSHPDHFGLAGEIKTRANLQILMHKREHLLASNRFDNPKIITQSLISWVKTFGVLQKDIGSIPDLEYLNENSSKVDVYVDDGYHIDAENLKVIWTPGHSPGHICVYRSKDNALFVGDHILPQTTPIIPLTPFSTDNPLGDYLNSLNKTKSLNVKIALPSHGHPITDVNTRITEIEDHHKLRLDEIYDALSGSKTLLEVASSISWSPGQFSSLTGWGRLSALLESLSHLRHLERKGLINQIDTKDATKFTKNVASNSN